jgi:hypothetical protein
LRPGLGLGAVRLTGVLVLFISTAAWAGDLETAVPETYATNEGMLTQATSAAVAELFMGFKIPDGASLRVEPAIENRANWFVETDLLAYLAGAGYRVTLGQPPGGRAATPSRPLPPPGPPQSLSAAQAQTKLHGAPSDSAIASGDSTMSTAEPSAGDDSTRAAPPDTLAGPNLAPAGTHPPETVTSPSITSLDESEPEYVLRYRVVLCELSYPEKYRTSPFGSRKVERRASVSLVAQLLQGGRRDVVWVGKGHVEHVNVVPAGKLDLLAGTDFQFNPPPLEQKGMGGYVEPVLVTGIVAGLIYLFYANQN